MSQLFSSYMCDDIDECLVQSYNCTDNSTCKNAIGSYLCACNEGYKQRNESEIWIRGNFRVVMDSMFTSNQCCRITTLQQLESGMTKVELASLIPLFVSKNLNKKLKLSLIGFSFIGFFHFTYLILLFHVHIVRL